MDKKQLAALTEEIVTEIATKNKLSEAEARTFVGVALRNNRNAFIEAVKIPTLTISQ